MKMMPKWMHKDAMEMVNIKKRYKIGCKNIMQKWTKKEDVKGLSWNMTQVKTL